MAIRLGKMKINRLWLLVGMALLLGLLATWLSVTYLRNREQAIQEQLVERAKGGRTVTVIVPTSDMPKGAVLQEGVVAGREIAADLAYGDTLTVDEFDAIKGRPLLRAVQRGRPLMRQDIIDDRPKEFSRTLTTGMRAITVDIDEINSIAQMIKPGDFIDMNLITNDPATTSGQQIFALLQNVKVIATGNRTNAIADAALTESQREALARYATVTVEVSPEEAAAIALAQTTGRIRTTLRSPDDKAIAKFGPVTTAQIVGGKIKAGPGGMPPKPVQVEYIVGGKAGAGASQPINISVPGLPGLPTGAPATGNVPGNVTISGLPPQATGAVNTAVSQASPLATAR